MTTREIPTFSVVIPLYSKERYIARAVQSVLNQTCPDFELIVVDDGSTDGGAQVVEAIHDPRVRLFHQENAGVSAARNRGVAEARADLIAFLDADDRWLPVHLETIKRLAEKYPECGAYATGYSQAIGGGRIITRRCCGVPDSPWEGVIPNYLQSRLGSYIVTSSSVAIRRDVFTHVGVFPVGERQGEDDDMWIRIALRYDIAYSHCPGMVYHRDADNRISDDKSLPFRLRLFDTLAMAAKSDDLKPGISRDDVIELRNAFVLGRVSHYLLTGELDAEEARVWLQETASTRLYEREWQSIHTITSVPWLLPAWRLKTRLSAILYRFGVRRPRFLSRGK